MQKTVKFPRPTANDTTGRIVDFLNAQGFVVWRQNTTGIYDAAKGVWRKNPNNRKGVADIIGFDRSGLFVAVEVKIGEDRLSDNQAEFLTQVKMAGGMAMVARSWVDFLQKWEKRKLKMIV